MASSTIETQRAMRKTALKNAPRISARTHYRSSQSVTQISRAGMMALGEAELTPYENLLVVAFAATETAHRPTSSEMISFN